MTVEQARIVAEAQQGVEVRDPHGHPLAFLQPLRPEEVRLVAEARRRLQTAAPGIPSARVLDMMAQLQQLQDHGTATPEAIRAVVQTVVPGSDR